MAKSKKKSTKKHAKKRSKKKSTKKHAKKRSKKKSTKKHAKKRSKKKSTKKHAKKRSKKRSRGSVKDGACAAGKQSHGMSRKEASRSCDASELDRSAFGRKGGKASAKARPKSGGLRCVGGRPVRG